MNLTKCHGKQMKSEFNQREYLSHTSQNIIHHMGFTFQML